MILGVQPTGHSSRDIVAAASLVGIVFMGSTLVTPLYAGYQAAFGFSEFTLTLVYASYVVGNLAALMSLGRLSDRVGRKPVALSALVLAIIATVLFLAASNVVWLFTARLLSGVAVALGSGAGTAWLVDLFGRGLEDHASLFATTANFGASAVGPLVSGMISQFYTAPAILSWSLYLIVLTGVAGLVAGAHETVVRARHVPVATFVPIVGVPRGLRTAITGPLTAAFCTFAMLGYYLSVMPSVLAAALDRSGPALSGAIVFEVFGVALFVMICFRRIEPSRAMLIGFALAVPGLVSLLFAQLAASLSLLLFATAVIGVSAGTGFLGSLGQTNAISPEDRRGQLASTYYVACFVGASVPIVAVGGVTTIASPAAASIAFVALLVTLSVAAFAVEGRSRT